MFFVGILLGMFSALCSTLPMKILGKTVPPDSVLGIVGPNLSFYHINT